ncbi:hypothetical protein P9294_gp113 [Bacillus phage FADO]|uniref:Uncharacterized protein n=1 Tax=Bacillus phage FADO TaxID=2917160 RepID=A0AAE9GBS7_9CAUD|nr:hypothetical protein P9294_gp113 [Bacillus phage FADO]UNY48828.1 hypothetical protein fado_113 [Bacillus phage FADO]
MNKIIIEIETGNAAFEDGNELSRILRSLADKYENGDTPSSERDINGNKVAKITYE